MPEDDMPITASAASLDPRIDGHEDRINHLEDGFNRMSVGLATNTAEVVALKDSMKESFKNIGDRVEALVAPVASAVTKHVDDDLKLAARVDATLTRLQPLEEQHRRAEARWGVWKKVGMTLLIAALGVLAKELTAHIFFRIR